MNLKLSKKTGHAALVIILAMFVMMSCAASRNRKKCDCPRWSIIDNGDIISMSEKNLNYFRGDELLVIEGFKFERKGIND